MVHIMPYINTVNTRLETMPRLSQGPTGCRAQETLNPVTRCRDCLIYYFGFTIESGQWALTWTNDKGYSKVTWQVFTRELPRGQSNMIKRCVCIYIGI